jgi:ribosomal protein S18 acetylase RimI-like enzyme
MSDTPAADAIDVREAPIAETRALRRAVLRPHQTVEQLAAEETADTFAAGAWRGATLVAVGLIAPSEPRGSWRVRGMATAPDARGHGAGTRVLDALLLHAREQGAACVWCNARTPALAFYERAGFRVASEVFDVPPIGPHVVMSRPI